jgi:type VI secretion system protein ImpH
VRERLFEESYRFDFFQAVRLLERMDRSRDPVGGSGSPLREAVRFRTRVSLEFPASAVHEIRDTGRPGAPPEMVVTFLGMTGPTGVLPHTYTELLIDRTRHRDNALWEFLDIFNHRMVSLFYRAWEKYRFPISYERTGEDAFTEYLFDLIGMGTAGLRGRQAVPDQGLLRYAGLIAQRPHSAVAIEAILRDYFGAPARLLQFSGQWIALEPEHRSRLGAANSSLGRDMVCGARIFNAQSKFRVRLGPLTLRQFESFLPPGDSHRAVADWTRFLAGNEFDFDMQLVLKKEEVPPCQLGAGAPPRLGWTSWVKTEALKEDPSEVVLSVTN